MSLDPAPKASPQPADQALIDLLAVPTVSQFSWAAVRIFRATLHNLEESEHARRFAARRLGEGGGDQASETLAVSVVADPSPRVRAECAEALGKIKHPDSIPSLIKALDCHEVFCPPGKEIGSSSVAQVAARALAQFSHFPREHLPALLLAAHKAEEGSASWLYTVASRQGCLPDTLQKRARTLALNTNNDEIRARCVESLELALGHGAPTHFIGVIKGWFTSQAARENASRCLGALQDPINRATALPVLVERARIGTANPELPDYETYEQGIQGLGAVLALFDYRSLRSQRELISLLGGRNASLDYQICLCLADMHRNGLPAEQPLFEALDSPGLTANQAAGIAQALGLLKSDLVVPKLLSALAGGTVIAEDQKFFRNCADAIARQARVVHERDIAQLCTLARTGKEMARVAALEALGGIPGARYQAFKTLLDCLDSRSPFPVNQAACNALTRLNCVRAIPMLKDIVLDPLRSPLLIQAAKYAILSLEQSIPGQSAGEGGEAE